MYAATFEKDGQAISLAPDEIAADDEISYEISAKTKLTLLVYPQFSAWGFPEKQTTVTLLDVKSHALAFYGRVTDVQDSMDSTGKYCRRVTCVNEMDFLDDTRTAVRIAAGSDNRSHMILQTLINAHNATVGVNSPRAFTIGDFSAVASKYLTESIKFDYVTTLDALKKIFVETFKAEIRTRHVNGVNYIDVGKFGSTSQTVIKIGDNLQNIRASYSAADKLVTRLIPLGGVGYNGSRLTIRQASGNVSGNNYIDNAELVSRYGIHEGTMIVNDLTASSYEQIAPLSQQLYEIGVEAAAALSIPAVEITLSALDLQKLGLSGYTGFALGNTHMTICPKLGIYNDLRITGLKRKLSSPQNTELTISTVNRKRDKAQSSLSAKLAAIDRDTNRKIDDNSYTYTEVVNYHFDGVEQIKRTTKTEYEQGTKDSKTAYFVDDGDKTDLYLGDRHINTGGGGVIEYAAIVQGGGWTPASEPISAFYSQGVPAYYGGAPARMVIQGYRMLFNVPYEDITVADVYSDITFKDYYDGALHDIHAWVLIARQTATEVRVEFRATIDDVSYSQAQGYYARFGVTPSQMQGFSCGICLDFAQLDARPTGDGNYPYLALASGVVPRVSSQNSQIFLVGFLGGTILPPTGEDQGSWRGNLVNPSVPILTSAENEYHFNFGTSKRFEPEVT